MEKLLAMIAAALLTEASLCGGRQKNDGHPIPIDPTIADPDQRNLNLEAWELFRIYYSGIVQALADEKDWPSPKVPVAGYAGLVQAVTSLTTGAGPLAKILQAWIGAIPLPTPTPTPPPAPAPTPAAPKVLPVADPTTPPPAATAK